MSPIWYWVSPIWSDLLRFGQIWSDLVIRVTGAWACEVQAVRAHAPLPYWSGAAIFDRAGSACRQYCSSSSALGDICWSCRAFNSPFNHRWPCVRCRRSTSVEQPTIWHSNIYTIIRQVQETSEILPLSTVFLQPIELVTTCTLTMLGALEVVRAAYCAL